MNEILLEYYAGRSKELQRCEGYIKEIINDLKSNGDIYNLGRSRSVIHETEAGKKLMTELTEFFNVAKINIYWKSGKMNGYTNTFFSSFMAVTGKNNLATGKYTNMNMHIVIYEDVITKANLNEREVLALLLHEIGHNFYMCPIMLVNKVISSIVLMLFLPLTIIQFFIYAIIEHGGILIDSILKKHCPFVINTIDLFKSVNSDLSSLMGPFDYNKFVSKLLTRITESPTDIVSKSISGIIGYGEEQGADTFAARYGYGSDIISGLKKLEAPEVSIYTDIIKGTGSLGAIYYDLNANMLDLFSGIIGSPTPNTNQRCQTILAKLKRDMAKNDYPAPMKKDLEAEIKRMEEICDKVSENPNTDSPQMRKTYYDILNGLTKGHSDLRELLEPYFKNYQF